MNNNTINAKTSLLLSAFIERPSSTVLLNGIRDEILENIVTDTVNQLLDSSNKQNVVTVEPEDNKSITVEQIRELHKSLTSLVKSNREISRIAIIWNVDKATSEAQNSLLKMLEEPSGQTLVILQANNLHDLLPTIISRCQIIPILPISRDQSVNIAKTYGKTGAEAENAYLISGGEAGTLIQKLSGESSSLDNRVKQAKVFLNSNESTRINMQAEFDSLTKLRELLDMIEKIANAAIRISKNETSISRWVGIIREIRNCRELLQKNVVLKLVFTRLCVCL